MSVNRELDSNEIKPDLYIIAGYSGCGKSTLLNLSRFSIDNIFNRNSNRIKIQSIEAIEFINKRRSLVDENIQAMLFYLTDIRFVEYQKQSH